MIKTSIRTASVAVAIGFTAASLLNSNGLFGRTVPEAVAKEFDRGCADLDEDEMKSAIVRRLAEQRLPGMMDSSEYRIEITASPKYQPADPIWYFPFSVLYEGQAVDYTAHLFCDLSMEFGAVGIGR